MHSIPAPLAPRVWLGIFAAWFLLLVAISLSPARIERASQGARGAGDVALYRAEIERIRGGEGYYPAAAAELRSRGYPTTSLLNWRTPLPMWLAGRLPGKGTAKCLITAVAAAAIWMWFGVLKRELGLSAAVLGAVLQTGALLPTALGDLYVMPEVWSGALVALSLGGYATRRPGVGVTAGLAALWCRELAGLYSVLVLAEAVWQRRWREAAAWTIGIAAYAGFYAWHASQVLARIEAGDLSHTEGWIRFGGAAFLVATAQMNCWLLLLPQPAAAGYLALATLGLWSWKTANGGRVTAVVLAYLLAFSVVGQPFNQYWGSLYAPLLALGAAAAPEGLRGLLAAARTSQAIAPHRGLANLG